MRPLYLKIAGLNSFRDEQKVDFTQLCESGVFGIFGPTGSGKSTILDAVTLALYGKVERAKGGTQGIINQNEEKASVYFAFQIGKRKFIAERCYKKGTDGSVNQSSCRLAEDAPDGMQIIAEKKREMDEQVQNILGLTAEDFTRAVVLPQGKFQEFLTLQGAERRRMLQRIFALEKYGEQLTQRIRGRLAETKIKDDTVKSRQSELGDASLETLNNQERNLHEANRLLQDLKDRAELLNRQKEEYQQILTLQTEYHQAAAELAKLNEKNWEFTDKKEKLAKAIKAEKLKPFIEIVNQEFANKEKVLQKMARLEKEVADSKLAYDETQSKLLSLQKKLDNEGEILKEKIIKLEEALSIEQKRDDLQQQRERLLAEYQSHNNSCKTLLYDLSQLKEQRIKLKERQQQLSREIEEKGALVNEEEEILQQKEAWQQLQDFSKRYNEFLKEKLAKEESYQTVCKKIEDYFQQVAGINEELSALGDNLQSLKQPTLNQLQLNSQREQLAAWEKEIFTLTHYHGLQITMQQDRQEFSKEKTDLQGELEEKNQKYSQIVLQKDRILQETAELEKSIKAEELHNYAELLKGQLEAGKPCPVCGSLEHPQKAVRGQKEGQIIALQSQLTEQKGLQKKLEDQVQIIFQQCTQLNIKITNIKDTLKNMEEECGVLVGKYQQSLAALPQAWRNLTPQEIEEKYRDALQLYKEQQKDLEEFIKVKEKLIQDIEKVKKVYSEKNILLRQAEAKADSINEDLALLKSREEVLNNEKEEKEKAFICLAKGQQGQDIVKKYEKLREAKQALENLRKEEKSVLYYYEQLYDELQSKNEAVMSLQQKLESVKLDGQNCSNLIQELTGKINEVTNGKRVQEVKEKAEREIQLIKTSYEKAVSHKEEKRQGWEEAQRIFYSMQQELKQAEERITNSQQELIKRLQELDFHSPVEAESYLASPEEMQAWEKEIDEYQKLRAFYLKNISDLEERLAGRNISQEQWQEFNENLDVFQKELELQVQKVHNLTFQVKILKENHLRWSELERHRQVLIKEIDQLLVLEKLFKGNTFVEFIAEEQLMHVALDASRRLGELTNYRYGLEIDSEGGFIIRDDSNGGLRRPVATLSGGETFLTSLALALALSSQIQLRGKYPLEFFFLDEGFGTLDNYLLETVMNSLERLQKEQMTIGIISHVPELRARMARSLLVEPAEKGGRGSQLSIALA